jgi:hypothetical protein
MNVPQDLTALISDWTGTNRLWLSPEEEAQQSGAQAALSLAAQGKFLLIRYTWVYQGEPQDGTLLIGFNQNQQVEKAVWIDSWHMNDQIMVCQGERSPAGLISLTGSYPAPPGPDWGWWIEVDPLDGTAFKLVMYNVSPEGQANPAVEAAFGRPESTGGTQEVN